MDKWRTFSADFEFPSPCGDKLKWAFFIFDEQRVVLSSPQGDKLK